MQPIIPLNSKINDPALILDQEVSDARRHKIQLLRSEDPKWYKEDFIRNQNIETLRKSEGVISTTVTDFRLSSEKHKVNKMIDIYERHKSKHSIPHNSASPDRKITNQSKTGKLKKLLNPSGTKNTDRRIIFHSTNQKKLSPKLDLRNMKTVANFKHYSRNHIPTLPEHKKHIQSFRQKVGMVIETLTIHTKNPYKILQSLVTNLGPFYQKLPGNKDQRLNLPIKIQDSSGNLRDLDVRINTQNLEQHLLEKYSARLLQHDKYNSAEILKKMTKEYQELLNKLVSRSLVFRIPREYKVSLDDFNDFYVRKSQDELDKELEEERQHDERQREAAEKTVEQEIMEIIEEQVNEVTETLIIPSENQMTDEEPTTDNNTFEVVITEAQTERAITENDLKPVVEEAKPQYSHRTYYEEEEDEEEFQRRQEEKKKKRMGQKYGQQVSAPVESPERNTSENTDDMRRNIQEYIEKLDHDIEHGRHRHSSSIQQSSNQSANHSSRQSQQFYHNHPESQVSYPSTNSLQTGYLRHVSQHSQPTSSNMTNFQHDSSIPRNPTSTPDTTDLRSDLKNPSASLSRARDAHNSPTTDMLIITSGNETGTNKSKKPHINSSSTIREKSQRRERGSQGHGSDGRGSTDGRSDNESQGKFRKSKRSSQKFVDARSVGTSASEYRAKFVEYEKYDRATLIQMLLEAPSILDSDIKIKDHGDPVTVPSEYKFENDKAKTLFSKVYTWHQVLHRELKFQESELHLENVGSSSSENSETEDDDDF